MEKTVHIQPKWMYKNGFSDIIKALQASQRKKDNDTMTMKFLLHKDKERKVKSSPQKQECGCKFIFITSKFTNL